MSSDPEIPAGTPLPVAEVHTTGNNTAVTILLWFGGGIRAGRLSVVPANMECVHTYIIYYEQGAYSCLPRYGLDLSL